MNAADTTSALRGAGERCSGIRAKRARSWLRVLFHSLVCNQGPNCDVEQCRETRRLLLSMLTRPRRVVGVARVGPSSDCCAPFLRLLRHYVACKDSTCDICCPVMRSMGVELEPPASRHHHHRDGGRHHHHHHYMPARPRSDGACHNGPYSGKYSQHYSPYGGGDRGSTKMGLLGLPPLEATMPCCQDGPFQDYPAGHLQLPQAPAAAAGHLQLPQADEYQESSDSTGPPPRRGRGGGRGGARFPLDSSGDEWSLLQPLPATSAFSTFGHCRGAAEARATSDVVVTGRQLLRTLLAKEYTQVACPEAGRQEAGRACDLWRHMLHECDPPTCTMRHCCCARSILRHMLSCELDNCPKCSPIRLNFQRSEAGHGSATFLTSDKLLDDLERAVQSLNLA